MLETNTTEVVTHSEALAGLTPLDEMPARTAWCEPWCTAHQYDGLLDDDVEYGDPNQLGWCEASEESGPHIITLTNGTLCGGGVGPTRIEVGKCDRDNLMDAAEAGELAEAIERAVAAARGVATTDPERRRLGAVSIPMFDELAARLGVDLVDMMRAVMATVHAADGE